MAFVSFSRLPFLLVLVARSNAETLTTRIVVASGGQIHNERGSELNRPPTTPDEDSANDEESSIRKRNGDTSLDPGVNSGDLLVRADSRRVAVGSTGTLEDESSTALVADSEETAVRKDDDDITWLATHNKKRADHGAPDLSWSDVLATNAKSMADFLASNGPPLSTSVPLMSSTYDPYTSAWGPAGQNIATSSPLENITDAVEGWYDDKSDCGGVFPGCNGITNSFTAMIWVCATQIGCAVSSDGDDHYYICLYKGGDTVDCTTPNVGMMDTVSCLDANVLDLTSTPATCTSATDPSLAPSPSGAASDTFSSLPQTDQWVAAHNMYRCRHDSDVVTWSTSLATQAQALVSVLPTSWEVSNAGESIGWWSMGQGVNILAQVDSWYGMDDTSTAMLGTSTAMLRDGVTQIGCAVNTVNSPPNEGHYYVCLYTGDGGPTFDSTVKPLSSTADQCVIV